MPKKLNLSRNLPADFKDGKFLDEARDRFKYCLESWRDIRDEHDLDMRFLAGDAWDPIELRARKDKHRPFIHLDEITQFVNQLINDVRQNKRAVKATPEGEGATQKSAENRADWIRGIEYKSNAQAAYITALEGAVGGSYGAWKLETYYDQGSFNQSVRIVPIPNANTILWDPDCKMYDCSDAEDCFEIEFMSEARFKRRWKNSAIATFTDDILQVAPDWIKPKQVQVASWWKVKIEQIQLHLVDVNQPGEKKAPEVMRSDELPDKFDRGRILKTRDEEDRRVIQYIINGIEVLETNDPKDKQNPKGWPGKWIPIIGVFGKELFVDEGSGSRRKLFSLIRLARDPQRLLNYYASQEMEEAKLSPRTPYLGAKGQFDTNTAWDEINDTPKAYAEYNPMVEGVPTPLGPPERMPFVPNFQQYEMVKESAKRSIMSGMGISPLPTAAQRNNEKSGVALDRIQGERAQGSFHFIDNFDRSLEFSGRQLDDLFDVLHDVARDVPLRDESGKHTLARVNDPGHKKNRDFKGKHGVTISVGPSRESEREDAAEFADTIAKVPGVFPLIGDLLVRLRNLGPIGEQIAQRLTPPQFAGQEDAEPLPPAAQAAMGQLNAKVQQMQTLITQLMQEKAAKMLEKDAQKWIAALQENTKLVVAQASLQRDNAESILQGELQKIQTILDTAHDHMMADHQADLDRQNMSHQASLTPPPTSAQNGGQPSNGQPAGQ
jgi:hypothetical protein